MNTELSRDIDKFIAENEEEIFRNIARLVAINSVETEAKQIGRASCRERV